MSSSQKKKIMSGLPEREARIRLLGIFADRQPGKNFDELYPGIYPWMEVWFRLRSRNETFEAVAQAFAEKISNTNKQKVNLEKKVRLQREEIARLSKQIENLRKPSADTQAAVTQEEPAK
jgi:hypothetical protein